jgi:signal peptidase I
VRGEPALRPTAPVRAVRANRVILVVAGVLLGLLLLGLLLAVLGARSIGWAPGARTVHVFGSAMAPTIDDGDYLLAQPYSGSSPGAGDIILMDDPYDHSRVFIKRIVAGPRKTIQIRSAQVIVDGRPLTEPYAAAEPWTTSTDWPPARAPAMTLGPDEYFVLGDNRDHSSDSRIFGPIHRADIQGHVVRILLPSARARAF